MHALAARFVLLCAPLLVLGLSASPALAQVSFMGCSMDAECTSPDRPTCLRNDPMTRGACVPSACAEVRVGACFSLTGATVEMRFLDGDCDGHLIRNGLGGSMSKVW